MTFNPELLVLARNARGKTQKALAVAARLTQAMISHLERGLRRPSERVLAQLAGALEFPEPFFLQPGRVWGLPATFHRRKASARKSDLQRLHADLALKRMGVVAMLKHVDLGHELELPQLPTDVFGSARRVAQTLRDTWLLGDGPIRNLTGLIESAGVVVIPSELRDVGVDAVAWKTPAAPPLVFVDFSVPPDRLRLSLAHELGHLVMHDVPAGEVEKEAFEFASEFLVPSATVRDRLRNLNLRSAMQLKMFWGISMAALIRKAAKDLRVIPEKRYRYLMIELGRAGWRKREPVESDPPIESPQTIYTVIEELRSTGYSDRELASLVPWYEPEFQLRFPKASSIRLVS